MKKLIAMSIFLLVAGFAWAGDGYTIYEGTYRDYSKPAIRVEKNSAGQTEVFRTLPGSDVRDYSQPPIQYGIQREWKPQPSVYDDPDYDRRQGDVNRRDRDDYDDEEDE